MSKETLQVAVDNAGVALKKAKEALVKAQAAYSAYTDRELTQAEARFKARKEGK